MRNAALKSCFRVLPNVDVARLRQQAARSSSCVCVRWGCSRCGRRATSRPSRLKVHLVVDPCACGSVRARPRRATEIPPCARARAGRRCEACGHAEQGGRGLRCDRFSLALVVDAARLACRPGQRAGAAALRPYYPDAYSSGSHSGASEKNDRPEERLHDGPPWPPPFNVASVPGRGGRGASRNKRPFLRTGRPGKQQH